MASSDDESQPQVAQLVQTDDIIVTDAPKIDLESYIQNYRGRTRVYRLILIASTSTVLAVDALKLAVQEIVGEGKDVELYRNIVQEIRTLAPNEAEANYDKQWAEKVDKANQAELSRLESELKGYKNNLVKESIRMGNEDLARHYESMGDLNQAYEAYAKMRSDVSSTKHIVEVGFHLARVSVYRHDWAMVIANVNKISGLQTEPNSKTMQARCNALYGIALLGQYKYTEAAQKFFQVDPILEPEVYDEYASLNDIAVYGGLLALATMSRKELTKFLESSSFRAFLELEPHLRRAISQFITGRYSACLAILESYRPDYLLDIYLQPHLDELYGWIRGKCIHHFLLPFSCVTLDSMNEAFAPPGGSIEEELADMIRDGGLEARIDSIDKLVTTTTTNPRVKMQVQSLNAARSYEKDAVDRIRRIGILSANLEVKGRQRGGPGLMNPADDAAIPSRYSLSKDGAMPILDNATHL
ncbi:hypothetical protein M406DRAFT_105202 [Cryphonectria parasitica EP155]|uniref:PCI domain-containing protein n=1 Tax=Cryphonectria parasitica (strain ATCC 38755 / EP155) TaxID=660469 RepID=A0A9P4YDN5_CRYP1|nr:uncharacterized protein M406DRAFT_105202 [Cryphonectria parasitica EP155]KAF3771451.1 hypothetical protein M406DRAFT_105202 [Cryphonectria parasitica EP155]